MDVLTINKLQLIKKDITILKKHLFTDNDINDWNKLIIIYNFYLILAHIYIMYNIAIYMVDSTASFSQDFMKTYLFFFIMCNLQNSYRYFILNISKIDYTLANNLYSNTKEYFI
jgi:hypothetical protein